MIELSRSTEASMKNIKCLLFLVFIVIVLHVSVSGQAMDNKLATVSAAGSSVRWDVAAPNAGLTLIVSAPDGRVFSKDFKGGSSPDFSIADKTERLPDGQYTYELRLTPISSATRKDVTSNGRGKDDEPEAVRAARKSEMPGNSMVESGSFSIVNGSVIVAGSLEEGGRRPVSKITEQPRLPGAGGGNAVTKNEQHHARLISSPDDVIPDDLIVQGSACVGLDCVNGEVFGFDTIRLKENNTRIQFDDTSAAGFPLNNWQIRANSSAAGGASFLGFLDQGATGNSETGTIVFEVDAGAPANALKVSSTGKVGLRTATPALDLHITTSDTPAHRLEQTNAGGFTAQTWDIAGNEANFFVRDVTGGSRLPFRIRPGAPTSSLDINASGSVGIGTSSPNKSGVTRAITINGTTDAVYEWAVADVRKGTMYHDGTVLSVTNNANGAMTFGTNNAERVRIDAAGNVGIGTTVPDLRLSVSGDADKSAGGGSWQVFSDERLKNIKGNFSSGLKAVMQLQPIRFQYKQDNALGLQSEKENVGFGAQTLEKVVPEAVTRNSNGYLMVNNDPILWTMLNAIKEQQKEIEQLKGQIKQLRASSRRHR
jgi:hypothetical protein